MPRLLDIILRSRTSKRSDPTLSIDDYAMKFLGNQYPLGMMSRQGNRESVENNFTGYVEGAFKSNGVVYACIVARLLIFCEARFQFRQFKNGRPQELYGTSQLDILETPWPNGTTGDLLAKALLDVDLCGNFFAVREGNRLRRLRPDWVTIVLSAPPEQAASSDIEGYIYKPGGESNTDTSSWEIYPINGVNGKVAHWAPIPDPLSMYMGMSWLTPVLREIEADKATTKHKAKFFENAATPNLAVTFSDQLTLDQFKAFMEAMDSAKGGVEHAYETLYLGGGATVQVVGSDLRQLDFKATQGAGETRIAAAAQVHPVIVGLSEGMQGSALNAGNYKSAKEAFGERVLRPLWRTFAAAMEAVVTMPAGAHLWYDDRDIAFLRQDRMELAQIQHTQQQTITGYVMQGFTPESARDAVMKEDLSLLKHTGLYSVQLLPPGEGTMTSPPVPKTPGGKGAPPAPVDPKSGKPVDPKVDPKADPKVQQKPSEKPPPKGQQKPAKPARDEGSDDDYE